MPTGIPIAHFEAKYVIYPDGRIWNKGTHKWKSVSKNPNGYYKVLLALNGVRKQFLVHQLVAKHFLPNPYGHIQVNHKDGNKAHNGVSNLEWISNEGNIQHSLETGLRKGFMSLDDKLNYLNRVLEGEQVKDIAEELGRHPVVLSKMLRNAAEKVGLSTAWTTEMKKRRKDAALRNLATING